MVAHATGAIALALLVSPAARADWPPEGVALCTACRARATLVVPDGSGGAFVAWTDARNGIGSNEDTFLQRVTSSGAIASGWPVDGLPVSIVPGMQLAEAMAPDGLGGVIIAWRDHRNQIPGGTGTDIYAQRVLADGSLAPGWPVDGVPVTQAPGDQQIPVILADGEGGAFITWDEPFVSDPSIYVQHLTHLRQLKQWARATVA